MTNNTFGAGFAIAAANNHCGNAGSELRMSTTNRAVPAVIAITIGTILQCLKMWTPAHPFPSLRMGWVDILLK